MFYLHISVLYCTNVGAEVQQWFDQAGAMEKEAGGVLGLGRFKSTFVLAPS